MFSNKFTGPVYISMIFSPKFLACASLKNYGKNLWKISPDPINVMLNIGLMSLILRQTTRTGLRVHIYIIKVKLE